MSAISLYIPTVLMFATSGVGGGSSIRCWEQNKKRGLYGPMTDIPKIPKNMSVIFTAEDSKECRVRKLTGDWAVLVM